MVLNPTNHTKVTVERMCELMCWYVAGNKGDPAERFKVDNTKGDEGDVGPPGFRGMDGLNGLPGMSLSCSASFFPFLWFM